MAHVQTLVVPPAPRWLAARPAQQLAFLEAAGAPPLVSLRRRLSRLLDSGLAAAAAGEDVFGGGGGDAGLAKVTGCAVVCSGVACVSQA